MFECKILVSITDILELGRSIPTLRRPKLHEPIIKYEVNLEGECHYLMNYL